ncbi:MAG: molybdate ABC transporter substrate-binding protein [Pseudorhodoferax sp.]
MRSFSVASLVLALALPVASWAQQITVSAAASLTDAFKELAPQFEASKPGATVRFNFAASGVLLQQISQGAPVDVFASADQETMNRADAQKLIDAASRRNFVTNSLVLIEPAQGGAGITGLADLHGAAVKKIAVGKTATVPVGRYTKEVLDAANLWNVLEPKFVQADSVRQVLDYVSRGEVEAGFVYRTDATIAANKVKVVASPQGATPVSYPIAVVADSKNKAAAADFIAFVNSDAGQQVLARYGFGKP